MVPAAGPHQVPSQQTTILFDRAVDAFVCVFVPFIGRAVESGWECGFELTRVVVFSRIRVVPVMQTVLRAFGVGFTLRGVRMSSVALSGQLKATVLGSLGCLSASKGNRMWHALLCAVCKAGSAVRQY